MTRWLANWLLTLSTLVSSWHCGLATSREADSIDDQSRGAPVTMWVVGDLDSPEGQRQVKDNLRHLPVRLSPCLSPCLIRILTSQTEQCSSRLGFIHIPTAGDPSTQRFSTLLYHLYAVSGLQETGPAQLLALLEELDQQTDNVDRVWKAWSESAAVGAGSPLHVFTSAGWEYADVAAASKFWEAGRTVAEKLGVQGEDVHLLVNGRVSDRPAILEWR